MCYSIFDYKGKIQSNFSQTEEVIYSDFMLGKETSHELSYGKQLSPKVGRYIHKFLKKICSFLSGVDAFRGNTRSHPEHDG